MDHRTVSSGEESDEERSEFPGLNKSHGFFHLIKRNQKARDSYHQEQMEWKQARRLEMKREWQSEKEARRHPPLPLYRPPHKRADSDSPPQQKKDESSSKDSQHSQQVNTLHQESGTIHSSPNCKSRPHRTGESTSPVLGYKVSPSNHRGKMDDSSFHWEDPSNQRTTLYYPPHKGKGLDSTRKENGLLPHKEDGEEFNLEVEVQPNQWWCGVIQCGGEKEVAEQLVKEQGLTPHLKNALVHMIEEFSNQHL